MLDAGLQFAHGEDRIYGPMKSCRYHQFHQLQRPKGKTLVSETSSPENGAEPDDQPSTARAPCSNLDRFLDSTTPSVPVKCLCKTRVRGWKECDVEFRRYFTLSDLWQSFEEWSAYGAGVPLVLNGSDFVVQYYVPFLSGIQIYADSAGPGVNSRQPSEDSDGDYYRDSSSDGSSDCELEEGFTYLREHWDPHHPVTEVTCRMATMSLREKHIAIQEGFSNDDGEAGNSQGHLLFEYFERDQPSRREPLVDKILDLSKHFPELKTLRSCDLSSASWISVAWYPIYRIPTGPTLKDLEASFLTFHSLSTCVRDRGSAPAPNVTYSNVPKSSLPIFGLATYKFNESVWTSNGGCEQQQASSLLQAADDWLQELKVAHPDFRFFNSR